MLASTLAGGAVHAPFAPPTAPLPPPSSTPTPTPATQARARAFEAQTDEYRLRESTFQRCKKVLFWTMIGCSATAVVFGAVAGSLGASAIRRTLHLGITRPHRTIILRLAFAKVWR